MLGLACNYRPDQHLLLEPELLYWCKRQVSDSEVRRKLFVYRQMQVGTFVIGMWLDRPKRQFIDILNLKHSLSNFTKEVAQELRRRVLAPDTIEDTKAFIKQTETDYLHKQQDKNAEEKERRFLRGQEIMK